jgi:hypothetical protein
MSMPDMDSDGPFSIDPAVAVWALARELVEGQRVVAELGRSISAMQARHFDDPDPAINFVREQKSISDINTLRSLWYSKTLPGLIAKFAIALEAHETCSDGSIVVNDPIDAALWRSKYFVTVENLTVTSSRDVWPKRS